MRSISACYLLTYLLTYSTLKILRVSIHYAAVSKLSASAHMDIGISFQWVSALNNCEIPGISFYLSFSLIGRIRGTIVAAIVGARLEVGWGKVACWSTTAAISLKRVKIEGKLLWGAYRNPPTLFGMVPSPTPYGLPSHKIGGSQPPPRTSIAIISETVKATGFKLAGTFTGSIRTKTH